jgi:Tol biopolymer transport system component
MRYQLFPVFLLILLMILSGCISDTMPSDEQRNVPHLQKWGIYSLDTVTDEISVLYSTDDELSTLRLNSQGDCFVFSQQINGTGYEHAEICTVQSDGANFRRLTANTWGDLYPTWSPDGQHIAYLSYRGDTLDIYMMNRDGTGQERFYDSGSHDADIDWVDDVLVFTSQSCIWKIYSDGTNATQLTSPPRAGVWGIANLPFGDYDPTISPGGAMVAFERLEDDASQYGNYNIFVIDIDGSNETRLTHTNYSQGFPTWSQNGDYILYVVAVINETGIYDLYLMNSDGTDNRDITPGYVPDDFLCHAGVFSPDDSEIFFIGEWWT